MKKTRKIEVLTLVFVVVFTCSSLPRGVEGQIYWEKIFDSLSYESNIRPVPRRDAAIAYDIGRNRIVLFGGWQTNTDNFHYRIPVLLDDTWEFDLFTHKWRLLSYTSNRPSPRYGMLYSHNKFGLYIVGGRSWLEDYYNDLWVYDFREDQWYRMDQAYLSIVPEARYSPIGGIYPAYEFGDMQSDIHNYLFLSMGRAQYVMYDNMYVYQFQDVRGVTGIWDYVYSNILTGPFSFTQPHGRSFASSTMISPDEMLVFGGCLSGSFSGGPCPSSDSWLFSYMNRNWERVESCCLAPRTYSAMASIVSDGYRKSAVMFSGLSKDRTILTADEEADDEVALFDNLGKRWVKRKVQGFYYPEKRNGHVMCSGAYKNQYGVFVFGGYGHSSKNNLADLWFLKINMSTAFDYRMQSSFQQPAGNYKFKHVPCSNYFSTIHLHAIFMFFGWIILINLSTIISKYVLDPDRLDKHKAYRTLNRFMKGLGILVIVGGLFLGFWSSQGFPNLIHLGFGLGSFLLLIIEPISAYIKMSRKTHYYLDEIDRNKTNSCQNFYSSLYRTLSKNLTITALIFACVNISLGVFLAVFEWYWQLIWFFILGLVAAAYIVLEANKYFAKLHASNASKQADQKLVNLYASARSRSATPRGDNRSNTSSYIYNRDDISMDYLDSQSQSQQQQQQQRTRQNSASTCYSAANFNNPNSTTANNNNNSSRISTVQNDYSLRRPQLTTDEFYVSKRELIQSGLLSYSQTDKAYFKRVEPDN